MNLSQSPIGQDQVGTAAKFRVIQMIQPPPDRLAHGFIIIGEDRATLAVTGGETPGPMFDTLCAADIEWDRVDVMLTDERWVPETSERSNTRLVKERLLVDRAAAANYLPLYVPIEEPEHALEGLELAIAPKLPISVLILGMGRLRI